MFDGTKTDAKLDGKLTSAYKNNMRKLANFYRLKNNNFNLESEMVEINQNKKFETTRSTRCNEKTLFYLANK